jgi:hypothetical protein
MNIRAGFCNLEYSNIILISLTEEEELNLLKKEMKQRLKINNRIKA